MIPRANITAWRAKAPWSTDAQVEQDLVISRALVELYVDEHLAQVLAFRGGTALHKLYFKPAARYSEDIDLVQVEAGPIGVALDAIRARLDPWLGKPTWKQTEGRVTVAYRFESEMEPKTPLKLKVEINTREHLCVLGPHRARFDVESPWHKGTAEILTYEPEELLGTKLRALYQRKKGRDLFDLAEALRLLPKLDAYKIVDCFAKHLDHGGAKVTRSEMEKNLAAKITDPVFLRDVPPLLVAGSTFDAPEALALVMRELVAQMPSGSAKRPKRKQ